MRTSKGAMPPDILQYAITRVLCANRNRESPGNVAMRAGVGRSISAGWNTEALEELHTDMRSVQGR